MFIKFWLWLHTPSANIKQKYIEILPQVVCASKNICLEEQTGSERGKKTTTKHQNSQERVLF